MGCQLFTFECTQCLVKDEDDQPDPNKPKYKIQLWWGEHVGQNHKWVRTITDDDGTEHVDEHTVLNKYQ